MYTYDGDLAYGSHFAGTPRSIVSSTTCSQYVLGNAYNTIAEQSREFARSGSTGHGK